MAKTILKKDNKVEAVSLSDTKVCLIVVVIKYGAGEGINAQINRMQQTTQKQTHTICSTDF